MSGEKLEREILFYDGTCALCHGWVKFVLRHDREGKLFLFAPLGGATFEREVPAERRANLPDSVVVKTADGGLLERSEAILHILERMGGGWKALARVKRMAPRAWRDSAYDMVARVRYRIFGRTKDWCPVMGAELRKRFLE